MRLLAGQHALQMLTKAHRFMIAKWVVEKEGEGYQNIPSKSVLKFPQFFRVNQNA